MKKYGIMISVVLVAVLGSACSAIPNRVAPMPAGPRSWIDAPLNDGSLPLAPVQVISHSNDPLRITKVELSVNGAVIETDPNNDASQTLVTTHQSWSPNAPGNYTLGVRAQNSGGAWGDYATAVVTVGASGAPSPTPPSPLVQLPPPPPGATAQAPAQSAPPGATTQAPAQLTRTIQTVPVPPPLPTPPQPPSAPTATFRPVPPIILTIQPPLPPAKPGIGNPNANPTRFFWGGTICGATQTAITVLATDPDGIRDVQLYYRVRNSSRTENWASAAMSTVVINFVPFWRQTIAGSNIPGYNQSKQPWQVQYYFVATSNRGAQTSSPFYDNVTLSWCNLSH